MKNYSEEVISNIQNVIDNGNYSLINISSYDELPKTIYIGGTRVALTKDENGRHDCVLYYDFSFDKENIKEWKREPIGIFYSKDWKHKNVGDDRFQKYSTLSLFVGDVEVTALLRLIDASEFKSEEEFEYSHDLTINNYAYAIIKAFSPSIQESYASSSSLEEDTFQPKIVLNYGFMDQDGNDINNELPDASSEIDSVELF